MHCRSEAGFCVVGDRGPIGSPCTSDDDCESGLCGTTPDGVGFCTEPCRPGVICPSRQSCDYDAEVCVPWDAVAGQRCDVPDGDLECADGECVRNGDEARCASPCGLRCPSGFECLELDPGSFCWPLAPGPAGEGGCSCRAAGSAGQGRSVLLRVIGR